MRIIFVRHGESEHNVRQSAEENTPLTQKGRRQVSALAKRLRGYRISEIYTSSLVRAKETGRIISKVIGVPVRGSFSELDEYPGTYFNLSWGRFFHKEIRKRLKALKGLLSNISRNKNQDKIILIVAHGVTNRMILGHFLGLNSGKELLRFHQENACLNILNWKEEFNNWSANCLNDIEHLPKNLRSEDTLRK